MIRVCKDTADRYRFRKRPATRFGSRPIEEVLDSFVLSTLYRARVVEIYQRQWDTETSVTSIRIPTVFTMKGIPSTTELQATWNRQCQLRK